MDLSYSGALQSHSLARDFEWDSQLSSNITPVLCTTTKGQPLADLLLYLAKGAEIRKCIANQH